MKFGTRKADAPEQSGNYLRNFKKGETLVRFLDEPDDWILFREHYTIEGKSFPCTEDRATCPGCTHPDAKVNESKRKYAALVHLVKNDSVLPFRIPVTLSDRLAIRAERNEGTLLTRDYVVIKSGTGLDTSYDVDQEDKYEVDLKALKAKATIDIQDCLQDSFREVWGDWSPEGGETAKSQDTKSAKSSKDDDVPPTKPAAAADGAQGDDEVITEAQLRAMDRPAVEALAEKGEIPFSDEDAKSEIIDRIMARYAST